MKTMKKTVWAVIRKEGKVSKNGKSIKDDKYLLGKRSSKVNNSGQWGLFGGTVDKGESLSTALKRELYEESGLKAVKLRKLFTVVKDDKQFTFFEVQVAKPKVVLNKETSKFKFLTIKDAKLKSLHMSAKVFFRQLKTKGNLQFRLQMVRGELQQKVIAFLDGKVVGGATITIPNGSMQDFYVDKDYRGLGLGNEIMAYVMNLPAPPIKLTAQASIGSPVSGKNLVQFYSKWGFKVVAGDEHMARMERL